MQVIRKTYHGLQPGKDWMQMRSVLQNHKLTSSMVAIVNEEEGVSHSH